MLIENQLKKLGFGTAALFLLIVAVLLGQASMYLMAVILALVPVVGWLLNRILMRGLVCHRSSPETADEHGRILVIVTVENCGFFPKFYLRVIDAMPRFMRYAGSPPDDPAFITNLWPGESNRLRYYVEPQKRGLHRMGPLTVQATDIFGFSDLRTKIEEYDEILVYPETLPVNPMLLSSGVSTGWQDEQDARSRGSGTDFTGVREYQPGDELRRINWKTTARTGALAVTEFTQGYAGDIVLVLDCEAKSYENSGVGAFSAFEAGVKIAASLGAAALWQGSRVQLCGIADGLESALDLQGETGVPELLDRLARIEPVGELSLAQQMVSIAPQLRTGNIAIVVSARKSDDPELRAALDVWHRPPISAALTLFWLESESFAGAYEQWNIGRWVSLRSYSSERAFRRRTDLGVEYSVSADTSLLALLGGQIVG